MTAVQSRRLAQEVGDTYRLALVGGTFYLAGWLVVGIYGNAFSRAPLVSWLLVVIFTLLTIVRFAHRPPAADDAARRPAWLRYHWAIIVVSTAIWGEVFCWVILDPGFGRAQTAALLGTLGLATAFAHGFSMRRGFAFTGIGLLYLPGLLLLWRDPANRLDHFKNINDTRGHAVGDACLIAFASRIKRAFGGAGDLVARLGGEEFGVVLKGQDTAMAGARAQWFRDDLTDHPIAVEGIVLAVTASMGIAQFDSARHRNPDDLYRAADKSVYRAKAEGRNRVCAESAGDALEERPATH